MSEDPPTVGPIAAASTTTKSCQPNMPLDYSPGWRSELRDFDAPDLSE
jgi:hypothetical protein